MILHVYTGAMRAALRVWACMAALALAAACGGSSPTSPRTDPSGTEQPPVTPGTHVSTGTVVSAIGGAGAGVASFTVNGTLVGRSDANGAFSVGFHDAGVNRTVIAADGFVDRQTGVRAPAAGLQLSLIPSALELDAFNQMFRHAPAAGAAAALTRWTDRPALVIERRVLQFTDVGAGSYTALEETLTDADVSSIITDMTDGYAMLTGGLLGTFRSVTSRTSAPGTAVTISEPGVILVTRQVGLTAKANFWGYARWSTTADGEVTRGFIILDRDFEKSTSPFHRSLRMHELGHTLGCQHVTARTSVMNSNAQTEPNDFDRSAARIAHLRPVGNRPPDIDPSSHAATTAARTGLPQLWHGAH